MWKICKIIRVWIISCISLLLLCNIYSTSVLAWDNLSKKEFTMDVADFTPFWKKIIEENWELKGTTETINTALELAMKNMIVIFWVLALWVMTIGGWFMIFNSWDEWLRTKGKTMFMWGVISLAIALSSGIIVQLVRYILYAT